jgi:4-hydroxy 2-oxovalerate aldolase
MTNQLKVLDCTLRDGGYYNNWDFDEDLVRDYLNALAEAKIDYIELGLRNFPKCTFDGPFAYTKESYLNSIVLPPGPKYGVMIDAKTILSSNLQVDEALASLFVPAEESKLSLVRVAVHFSEVEKCGELAKILKAYGYELGFNLMQAGGKPHSEIKNKIKEIKSWECVDVIYFADSLGNMFSDEVMNITNLIRDSWEKDIGIHTHNNMGQALSNALTAVQNNVTWIDVTISGMGRGAGNSQTENFLAAIESEKYISQPIFKLAMKHFYSMQRHLGWGPNLFYYLGAKHGIHPTYIQKLISQNQYSDDEILSAIDHLSQLQNSSSYSEESFNASLRSHDRNADTSGSKQINQLFNNKNVLIIGNGPSVKRHQQGIVDYIERNQPIVISINMNSSIDDRLINYYCLTHMGKFFTEKEQYNLITKPILLPKHRFESSELDLFSSEILDYGMEIAEDTFEAHETFCVTPFNLTIAYSMAACISAQASKIFLVGIDGYDAGDTRQLEMIQLFQNFSNSFKTEITALTPTSYPLTLGSIYA